MALLCVVLAVMCVALAFAWQSERENAACWRTAAEYQLQGEGGCSN
jgi:predicted ABC-type exoprotein transport system permease subunit